MPKRHILVGEVHFYFNFFEITTRILMLLLHFRNFQNTFQNFPIHIKLIFMKLGPTGPEISSPAHLRDHSQPYGWPEEDPIENILFNRCYFFQYKLWSVFMELGPTESDTSSSAHLSDHSWPPHGGPEDGPTENILHPIDFTYSNIHYSRFSWSKVQHDQRYPLRPTFRTTLGCSVG